MLQNDCEQSSSKEPLSACLKVEKSALGAMAVGPYDRPTSKRIHYRNNSAGAYMAACIVDGNLSELQQETNPLLVCFAAALCVLVLYFTIHELSTIL